MLSVLNGTGLEKNTRKCHTFNIETVGCYLYIIGPDDLKLSQLLRDIFILPTEFKRDFMMVYVLFSHSNSSDDDDVGGGGGGGGSRILSKSFLAKLYIKYDNINKDQLSHSIA